MARKKKDTNQPTIAALTRELDTINAQLKAAYERFNYAYESELIDASIYEIAALRAHYAYVLRCIKELTSGQKRPFPQAVPVVKAAPPVDDTVEAQAAAVMKGGSVCHL